MRTLLTAVRDFRAEHSCRPRVVDLALLTSWERHHVGGELWLARALGLLTKDVQLTEHGEGFLAGTHPLDGAP